MGTIGDDLRRLEGTTKTFALSKGSVTLPHWAWAVAAVGLVLVGHVV